jgi:hypothetical protein
MTAALRVIVAVCWGIDGMPRGWRNNLAADAAILLANLENPPPEEQWARELALLQPAEYKGHDLPATPTSHEPGTPGKVEVMAARAALGVSLFHPEDAGVSEDLRACWRPSSDSLENHSGLAQKHLSLRAGDGADVWQETHSGCLLDAGGAEAERPDCDGPLRDYDRVPRVLRLRMAE